MNGVEMCLCGLKSIQVTLKLYLTFEPLRKEKTQKSSFLLGIPVISILLKVISVPYTYI
jgi:hypothetical protein